MLHTPALEQNPKALEPSQLDQLGRLIVFIDKYFNIIACMNIKWHVII